MASDQIKRLLDFANLQMASEAFREMSGSVACEFVVPELNNSHLECALPRTAQPHSVVAWMKDDMADQNSSFRTCIVSG